jgi:hypothetical protein
MLRTLLVVSLVLFIGLGYEVVAQDAGAKAQQLAAALDKTKYKKKEKANISIEIYIDIKNEVVAYSDPSGYTGTYEDGDDYSVTLAVKSDGSVAGQGYDSNGRDGEHAQYTLAGRIQGGLLVGTKTYDGGSPQPFEAVFVNRTIASGTNANQINSRDTHFGLGFIQKSSNNDPANGKYLDWTNRVFLQKR